jgi:hypothetical protein
MDRRRFVRTSLSSALALGVSGCLTGCEKTVNTRPVPGDYTLPPSDGITARVAAVRGENLDSMTRDAIDAMGGMGSIVDKGETVFITPNMVSFPRARTNNCFWNGECTKPDIIIATAPH